MRNVIAIRPNAQHHTNATVEPTKEATLAHHERHLRRKVIVLSDGTQIFFDLEHPVVLAAGDELVLDDGTAVIIRAADELLYLVKANGPLELTQLAWHIGNRHLAAEISPEHILIARDHVIRAMLEGLGATVTDILAPFNPIRGAYSGHGHDHSSGHSHGHSHHHKHEHEHIKS